MNVKMLKSFRVSPDGINVETVLEGQQITLPLDTAKALIRDKIAIEVKPIPELLVMPPGSQDNKNANEQNTASEDNNDNKKDNSKDSKKA